MTQSPAINEARLCRALSGFRATAVSELDRWRSALTLALCAGNLQHAQAIITDACEAMPAVGVLDDVLAPTMHQVGALWQHNRITVADEHAATNVCRKLVASMAPALQFAPPRSRERIVFLTPACERHTTGLEMAKNVLFGAGFDTVLLVAGLTDEALCSELLRYEPEIVALSLTMPDTDDFAATLDLIDETVPRARVITGGIAARSFPTSIPIHHVHRLDQLLPLVDSLLATQPA